MLLCAVTCAVGCGSGFKTGVVAQIMSNTGLYKGYDPDASSPSPASSSSGTTLAKASTTLARTPHLYGSREPQH